MEIEITENIQFSNDELNKMQLHSVFILLSLLISDLSQLRNSASTPQLLTECIEICTHISNSLQSRKESIAILSKIEDIQAQILNKLRKAGVSAKDTSLANQAHLVTDNIESLLNVLTQRTKELITRDTQENTWAYYDTTEITNHYLNFLICVARNSKGSYRIVFDPQAKRPSDYLVKVRIKSIDGSIIYMPLDFIDVMRDLLANARKYTLPGGTIEVLIDERQSLLAVTISDTGIGIPEHEILQVTRYGMRGSNIPQTKRQYGGGFGLTKAIYTTKKYNGRFWIDSKPGTGTKIRIEVPIPENVARLVA